MTLKDIEDRLRCKYGIDYEVLADALKAERERIEAELEGWRRYKAGIVQALNEGDGSYKP